MEDARRSRESRMQEMLDHYEITKAINLYCHGCDRGDHDTMVGVYLEDSWDDHGANKCPVPNLSGAPWPHCPTAKCAATILVRH